MELSSESAFAIALIGDSLKVDDKNFADVLDRLFKDLECSVDGNRLTIGKSSTIAGSIPMKIGYAGMISLISESIRRNTDKNMIGAYLEELNWPTDRIESLLKSYEAHKLSISSKLGINTQFPNVIDVDWRLDYYIKNNFMEKVDQPVYRIALKTENTEKDISFTCSTEQLQDLVSKLKDASKNIEKISQS